MTLQYEIEIRKSVEEAMHNICATPLISQTSKNAPWGGKQCGHGVRADRGRADAGMRGLGVQVRTVCATRTPDWVAERNSELLKQNSLETHGKCRRQVLYP
jgi:hypothetical protein